MPYSEPTIDADGIHVPTYDEILEHLIEQYKTIFGDDAYIGEETKDYQLLSVFSRCLADFGQLVVEDYNSRNPNYATGDSLDLLLPLVSMRREEATYSSVTLTLTGTAGTLIPAGSQAVDSKGYIWTLMEDVTLDSGGTGSGFAECEEPGEIIAPTGTITEINTVIDGWESVTNEAPADVGKDTETDAEVRMRRKDVVSIQNNGLFESLKRAIDSIDGVTFFDIRVNDTSTTDAIGIPGHSFCVVVKGGTDADVAEAIFKAKAPGIGTYGTTTQNYTDSQGHVNAISFTRPANLAVDVVITLIPGSNYDSTRCEEIIKDTITEAINKLGVGKAWGVTTAYQAIYNAFSGEECPFVLESVTGETTDMGSASSTIVPCAYNKILICEDTNITIVEDT